MIINSPLLMVIMYVGTLGEEPWMISTCEAELSTKRHIKCYFIWKAHLELMFSVSSEITYHNIISHEILSYVSTVAKNHCSLKSCCLLSSVHSNKVTRDPSQ